MRLYDIEFKVTEHDEDEEPCDGYLSFEVVSDKSFPEIAEFADSMIGKTKDGKTITAVKEVTWRCNVDVV
ncbi:hypothetical protein M0R72_20435 [Candidatus Pacearchaeota archaeon]|jgi:hypothetical protein|nr:hypothetical protein [Candidatus Pacearchaeota archaeon]